MTSTIGRIIKVVFRRNSVSHSLSKHICTYTLPTHYNIKFVSQHNRIAWQLDGEDGLGRASFRRRHPSTAPFELGLIRPAAVFAAFWMHEDRLLMGGLDTLFRPLVKYIRFRLS